MSDNVSGVQVGERGRIVGVFRRQSKEFGFGERKQSDHFKQGSGMI